MSDFSLTFDATPFLNGIKKITHGLSSIGDTSKQIEKNSSHLKDTMGSAINGLIAKVGALGGAYLGLRSILSNLPEIGKVWEIAGGIMKRNFFWPLRQEIAPYLQKFLNWTRDHRTLFVQWGQVLVNVFRTVKQTIMNLFEALRPIIETFGKRFKEIFGGSVKSVSDAVNIIAFRLFFLATMIIEYFRPVITMIDNIINAVWDLGAAFVEGLDVDSFNKSCAGILKTWRDMVIGLNSNDFGPVIESLKTISRYLGTMVNVFTKATEVIWRFLAAIGAAHDLSEMMNNLKSAVTPEERRQIKEGARTVGRGIYDFVVPSKKSGPTVNQAVEALKSNIYKTEKNINTPKAEVNINNLNLYGDKKEESQSQLFQMINDAIEKAMRNNLNKHGAAAQ